MNVIQSLRFMEQPPADLADTQAKLKLLYGGIQRSKHGARLLFTCTTAPCTGATLDVPLGAAACDLEQAYINKRRDFIMVDLVGALRYTRKAIRTGVFNAAEIQRVDEILAAATGREAA